MVEYKKDHFLTNFVLATEFKQGDDKRVEYHNIVVFHKLAEMCKRILTKGSKCQVIGRIQTKSWDTGKGKQYMKEIVANSVEFMEPKK